MTNEEKVSMYSALGVLTFIQNAIQEHKSQRGKMPHKIILGFLEWNIMGLDPIDDCYIDEVRISLNANVNSGIVVVENT